MMSELSFFKQKHKQADACNPVGKVFELCKMFSSEKLKQILEQKEFMPELRMNRRGKGTRGKQNERLGWTGNRINGRPLRTD